MRRDPADQLNGQALGAQVTDSRLVLLPVVFTRQQVRFASTSASRSMVTVIASFTPATGRAMFWKNSCVVSEGLWLAAVGLPATVKGAVPTAL